MINTMLFKINQILKLWIFKKKWRNKNKNNFTVANNIFPIKKVNIGKKTYGRLNIKSYGNSKEKLTIGSYCSIAEDVKFMLGGEHSYDGISTYPFKKYISGEKEETLTKGPITIKDDVWIGENSIILSGVTIGQGAIIAAGSTVAKDIQPYAIFAGGRIIKYRFPDNVIQVLLKFDFSELDETTIIDNIDFFYNKLNQQTLIEDLRNLTNNMI